MFEFSHLWEVELEVPAVLFKLFLIYGSSQMIDWHYV